MNGMNNFAVGQVSLLVSRLMTMSICVLLLRVPGLGSNAIASKKFVFNVVLFLTFGIVIEKESKFSIWRDFSALRIFFQVHLNEKNVIYRCYYVLRDFILIPQNRYFIFFKMETPAFRVLFLWALTTRIYCK